MVQSHLSCILTKNNKRLVLSIIRCLVGIDRIVHTLQINLRITKKDLISLRNKLLYCLHPIFFLISNRPINIFWCKALTNILNINRPHVFTIKIEWFNNWMLNWKRHLYFLFLFLTQKNFLYPVIKNTFTYPPQFFCFLFFVFWHTPIPVPWWMPSNRH